MFLKKSTNKKTGRTHLSAVHGYWDPVKRVSRTKTIKTFGYLDELVKDFADPIAYFTEIVSAMSEETAKHINLHMPSDALVEKNTLNRKNYGHIVFSKIYHELGVDRFLDNSRRHKNFEFNSESIMRLLLFGRLLYPHSKKKTLEIGDKFFDNFKFSLDDVYECLSHFNEISTELQRFLHEKVSEQYNRDTSLYFQQKRKGSE